MRPGCTIGLVFFFSFSAFFQDVDLIATSLRAGFQVYLSRSWVLCLQTKVVRYLFLRVGRMESINVAGVLQEAGDDDSRART